MDPKYHDPFWKLSCCGAEVSLKGCILHFCPKCGKRLDHDSSTAQVTPKPLYLPSASFSSGTTGYISGTNQGLTSWTPDFSTRSGPPAQYHSYTAPVISGQSFIPTGNPYVAYPTAPAAGRESIQRHPFSYHTQVLVPVMLPADGRVALSSVPDNIQGHRFDTNLAMSVSQSNKEMAAAQGMAASGGVHMAAFELGGQQLIASRGCDQPQVAAIDESLVHGLPSMRPVTQVAGSDPPSEMLRGHAYSLPEIGETEGSMMPTPCSEPREQDKREMKIDSLHEEVCNLETSQVRQQEQAGSNAATPSDLQRQTISKMTRECEELRSSLASLTAQLQEKTARLDEAVHEQKRLELSNKNLKDQLEKSEEEVNNLKIEISRLAKQILDLKDQIMTLREHDDQLTMKLAQDLKKLDANADVLRLRDAEICDLTHCNSDLQQKVEEFRGQNNKLQTQVSSLASRVTSLQEEITGLQQRRGELAQSERNAEVEELRNKLETSEKKCNSILQQWAEMSSDSEKLKKERDVDSQRYDQLMRKHNTSEATLMAEHRENTRVRQILNERTLRLDELKRTYEDVLKELNETTKRQNQAELKEQIDEYRMLLQQAEQLAERRGIDLTDLRRQLHNHEEEMGSIVVLKHQLEVYRNDFEAERKAREEKHAEADRLQQQLEQLQLRYQQLVDELEAYSIRHLDDMRRRHGQPPAAPASAPAAPAGYDPFSRASPALSGSNVSVGGSGLGVAGPAAAQPGRLVGGGSGGSVAQQWSTAVRPQPTMLTETEQGDYAPHDRQPRVVHQQLPGSASDSQMEYGADTRLGYAPAQQEQQRPPTFQLFPRQQLPQQQQPPMQQPLHVPQLQPGRADSLRCPVCNIEVPDFDSLNVHVNECMDLNGGN